MPESNTFPPFQQSRIFADAMSALAEFEQILLSNSGEDAFESAVKLLAAKLVDELKVDGGTEAAFKYHTSPDETHRAIQALYTEALARWPQLDSGSAELGISPPHLTRSIRPLLGWKLHGSNLSWLDATLERLVSRDSKGSLGQYFTPREITQLCVRALNPMPGEIVMDPACGSGGFLFEAMEFSKKHHGGVPKCLGIDFSPRSVKVAVLLAAAADESTITISKANSIDGRAYLKSSPDEWKSFLVQEKCSATYRASTWGAWNKLGCNVLLTNPPFAGDIDDADLLDAYEAQQVQNGKRIVSREHLFLERAVDLLLPGGRLAIVVPQGILSNSTSAYLREWLSRKCRILAVVGLHQHAFMPYTGVKTAVLFIEKPRALEAPPEDYPVLFMISRNSGKDSSGRQAGQHDYSEILDTLRSFFRNQGHAWALTQPDTPRGVAPSEIVMVSELLSSGRLDAEHYDPEARDLERSLRQATTRVVGSAVANRISRFKRRDYREVAYVDISSVDKRTGLSFPEVVDAKDAPSRASYLVEPGDVLVSTVRPDRNVVAMVTSAQPVPTVASNGFTVLRATELPPEVLFAYCKTETFKKILTMHATASMYPTVSDRDVLGVPLLTLPDDIQKQVVEGVRLGLSMIEEAQRKIACAINVLDAYVSDVAHANSK